MLIVRFVGGPFGGLDKDLSEKVYKMRRIFLPAMKPLKFFGVGVCVESSASAPSYATVEYRADSDDPHYWFYQE